MPQRQLIGCIAVSFVLALMPLFIAQAVADNRPRVAVSAFENKVRDVPGAARIGTGLAEMVTTELFKSGCCLVVERAALTDVLAEQQLAQSGLVRAEGAVKTGGLIGAQYVLRGAVTEFSDAVSGFGGGVKFKRVGASGKSETARVGIDLRLIDASSGQVLASRNVVREAQSTGGKINYADSNFQIGGGAFSRTPLGQATRAAVGEAVGFVTASVPGQSASTAAGSFKIVKVSGATVYVNAGINGGVRAGDRFEVYGSGEELVDPDTGLVLGAVKERIGSIRITDVKDRFAIGSVIEGIGLKRGDEVRR